MGQAAYPGGVTGRVVVGLGVERPGLLDLEPETKMSPTGLSSATLTQELHFIGDKKAFSM